MKIRIVFFRENILTIIIDIELNKNKVYYKNGSSKKEIHPFWLRERVDGEKFLDRGTQQRLFDPTSLNTEISINKANINNKFLEINFNDGVNLKLNIILLLLLPPLYF